MPGLRWLHTKPSSSFSLCVGCLFLGMAWWSRFENDQSHSPISISSSSSQATAPVWGVEAVPARQSIVATTQKSTQVATFELINRSKEEISIQSVTTTCGCSLARPLSRSSLTAGSRIQVEMEVTPPVQGKREVQVVVAFRSAQGIGHLVTHLDLVGSAHSDEQIARMPTHLEMRSYGAMHLSQEFQIESIELASDEPWLERLESTQLVFRPSIVSSTVRTRTDGRCERTYTCRIDANWTPELIETSPITGISGELQLVFRREVDQPVRPIRVITSQKSPLLVQPDRVYLTRESSWPATRRVVISPATDDWNTAVDNLEVESLPDGVDVSWLDRLPGQPRCLEVGIDDPDLIRQSSGTACIVLKDPESGYQCTVSLQVE